MEAVMLGRSLAAGLVAVLAIIFSASCGNEATPAGGSEQTGSPATALPALPLGPAMDTTSLIPKQTLVQRRLKESIPASMGGQTGIDGVGTLQLFPTVEEPMAWAIYKFKDVAPYYSVTGVSLAIHGLLAGGANDNEVFVGFADYNSNRWEWQLLPAQNFAPGYDHDAVSLSIPAGNFFGTGPDGAAYVAVVSYGRSLSVRNCTLNVDEGAPAPLGLTASQGTIDGGVKLSWIEPSITFGPDRSGDDVFTYSAVRVERSVNGTDWEEVGIVPDPASEFIDTTVEADSHIGYFYRIRTSTYKPGPQPGMPSATVTGYPGARPVAAFEASGAAPDLTLDASASFDPDLSDVISEYRWQVSYPQDAPGFVYEFVRNSGEPFAYELADFTKINRIDLTVVDDELFTSDASQGYDPTSEPFILWSPNLGCVQDDASESDPHQLVQGFGPGSYTVGLHFEVTCGNPIYRFEFDSHFDGNFGHGPKGGNGQFVPSVMLKDFSTAPNSDGAYSFTANVPSNQPDGLYYMAVRVTDGDGNESVYMWPDKVTLAP
jgi:hypothetical protein